MLNNEMTILLVEDNPGDYALFKEYLTDVFRTPNILHAETLGRCLELVKNKNIDVILLDLTLPDGMGISTFNTLHAQTENIPVIILTGLEDTSVALESLKVGAQDYLVKDNCTAALLGKSIQYGIERSKILRHLKKSEEQYKYLFNNNPLPMIAFDKKTRKIVRVNEVATDFYGYEEEEFMEMSLEDLMEIKNTTHFEKTKPPTYTGEDIKHQKKNKEIVDVELNFHDIILEGINAELAVIHNVTERNKVREQIQESEITFRTISENFPNGAITIIDKDFTVIYTAGKDFHVKEVSASYFQDTNFIQHFHPPENEKISEELMKVFEGNNTVFETRHNGFSYIFSAVPLYEKNKHIKRILIASQNITQQKSNEIEKELLIEELTQNNTDLRQFSYITSHNLRAPLSNLLGLLQLIDMSEITDPLTAQLLKNFEECTMQLNDTVNDLINILIIKNNVNSSKENLEIKVIFEKVMQSIQNNIDEAKAKINIDIDPLHTVEFNRTYLESVLLNLLTNAIKYRSPNRITEINVSTEQLNNGVKLYFSDNGLGIDLKRHKDKIFGLYQRFHDNVDSKGLGLYIVNSQIRVMGGEIEVQSEVDKGTTFIITFKN